MPKVWLQMGTALTGHHSYLPFIFGAKQGEGLCIIDKIVTTGKVLAKQAVGTPKPN